MQQLLAAAQQMQEQRINAQGELVDLTIAASAIDTDDLEETAQTIADLVLAAVRDAYARAGDLQQEKMGPFANALGGGMPGLPEMPGMPGGLGTPGAGGLGGLLGGPDLPGGGQPGTGQPGPGTSERPDSE